MITLKIMTIQENTKKKHWRCVYLTKDTYPKYVRNSYKKNKRTNC